jgi:benzodiazapine receptor
MQRYILLVSSIFSLVFAGIASTLPLGIYNQGQVSAFYPTLFTPATFTFSIWSIIYLSWILLGIFIALKNIKLRDENLYLLALAQVLSSFWLIPSQFLFIGTSFIVMM